MIVCGGDGFQGNYVASGHFVCESTLVMVCCSSVKFYIWKC